jgi:hypothetical protein
MINPSEESHIYSLGSLDPHFVLLMKIKTLFKPNFPSMLCLYPCSESLNVPGVSAVSLPYILILFYQENSIATDWCFSSTFFPVSDGTAYKYHAKLLKREEN